MSRSTDVPQPVPAAETELWRGLEELAGDPAFQEMLHREFPEDASTWADPVSRRSFLALAGASAALAGVGCSPRIASREKIYPYVTQPPEITLGLPLFFATGCTLNGVTTGVLAKSREGRPIKLEGNPTHPGSLGGIDAVTQASLLNLYDPDRSREIIRKGTEPTSFERAVSELRVAVARVKGEGKTIRILSETINSPTMAAVVTEFERTHTNSKLVQWEPAGRDNVHEGARLAFGEPVNVIYDFTKAKRVVSLDSDFLVTERASPRYARDFNSLRKTHLQDGKVPSAEDLNRLYVVESMLTATGSVADHRMPMKSADVEVFARGLAAAVGVALPGPPPIIPGDRQAWITAIAKDLQAHKGSSIVIAGEHQSPAVHAIAHAINGALGNVGKTVVVTADTGFLSQKQKEDRDKQPGTQSSDFKAMVEEMRSGTVGLLFILGVNPVYSAPADINFVDALARVGLKVHLGSHLDETGVLCDWHINEAHFLETWGDGKAYDGTVSISQPLIKPLFNGRAAIEVLSALLSEQAETTPRGIVKFHWSRNWPGNGGSAGGFEAGWQAALRDGVIPNTAAAHVDKQPAPAGIPAYAGSPGGTEINFRPDPYIFDGRFANNGWLQELPKPVTTLTWDNAIIVGPKMAKEKGLMPRPEYTGGGEHGRVVCMMAELTVGGRKVTGPVWVQPGHADDSVTVHLGYGREHFAGKVASQARGVNAYKVRGSDAPWVATGSIAKAEGEYILAAVQAHWSMMGRAPVRRANRDEYEQNLAAHDKNPNEVALFAKVGAVAKPEWQAIDELVPGRERATERHEHTLHNQPGERAAAGAEGREEKRDPRLVPLTIVPATNKEGRRWAMAIDLTTCIGCSSCVMACVAENNSPVVGKKEVTRGREMHWIRIDRYYEFPNQQRRDENLSLLDDPANLTTHFQPVPCQQCEKAPCEIVCPVAATMHSSDGLNDMVYNRCVGTRYCSNNCPYKVRRFNFLTFSDWKTDTYKLMRNPEVTVRERGVMEKCTYCVQRIRAAEVEAERQGRPINDGEILTACQQACPADAIVFGDLSDPNAKVNKWKAQPINYGLLAELNTMPRTTYLASIRNPNPELARA
jgi:molybdopterin-containing oxidoreductase family iron-sulfur binding subunit